MGGRRCERQPTHLLVHDGQHDAGVVRLLRPRPIALSVWHNKRVRRCPGGERTRGTASSREAHRVPNFPRPDRPGKQITHVILPRRENKQGAVSRGCLPGQTCRGEGKQQTPEASTANAPRAQGKCSQRRRSAPSRQVPWRRARAAALPATAPSCWGSRPCIGGRGRRERWVKAGSAALE